MSHYPEVVALKQIFGQSEINAYLPRSQVGPGLSQEQHDQLSSVLWRSTLYSLL